MIKLSIGVIVVLVVVLIGRSLVFKPTPSEPQTESINNDSGAVNQNQSTAGSYEIYTPEKIARAETGQVVLFFRAPWCPTCRALDADIRAKQDLIPVGLTILDVDYDTATTLKQKYGVTYQHTLVQVDSAGMAIGKWTGSPTLITLVNNIK